MSQDDLVYGGLVSIGQAIAAGKISSRDLTSQLLSRAMATDYCYHAFERLLVDSALRQAEQCDREITAGLRRGPIHGVPVAVKDLVSTIDAPTESGGIALHGRLPEIDSTIVRRLKQAGAVVIGKTKMTEGAATASYHPTTTPPRNPWDPRRSAGFSSSGSGVAVAAGLCFSAIGSDTGGSIRIPAAMNGLTGLKPTWGLVSRHGVFPSVQCLDTLGPLARSAIDVAAVLEVIAGPDENDPTTLPAPPPPYLDSIGDGVSGRTFGYDAALIAATCSSAVAATVEAASEAFRTLGARIVPVSLRLPDMGPIGALITAGVTQAHRGLFPERRTEYGPELAAMLELGGVVEARDVIAGIDEANLFKGRLNQLLHEVDMLLVPTLREPTPLVGALERQMSEGGGLDPLIYTLVFNLSGNPAIALPAGFDANGMPISVQLVGRSSDEASLLAAAHAFQTISDWHLRRPSSASRALQ